MNTFIDFKFSNTHLETQEILQRLEMKQIILKVNEINEKRNEFNKIFSQEKLNIIDRKNEITNTIINYIESMNYINDVLSIMQHVQDYFVSILLILLILLFNFR